MFAFAIGLSSVVALPAFAAEPQLHACKEDLAKAGCHPKNEAQANECIESHEKSGEKDEGLTHACFEAHEHYEKTHKEAEHHGDMHK
jgi:hypothetical protein